jgi:hypothetical protein
MAHCQIIPCLEFQARMPQVVFLGPQFNKEERLCRLVQ